MNKELANILKNRAATLPFMDVVAGLAQVAEQRRQSTEASPVGTIRFPIAYDHNQAECLGKELDLTPNSKRKSIIFFEDFGSVPQRGQVRTEVAMKSRLRLICWMNRQKLVESNYREIAGACMTALMTRIITSNPINVGMFTRMSIECIAIPPQNRDLFGRYTFDEASRQYLRPPFEAFGLDFECDYRIKRDCLEEIKFKGQKECEEGGAFSSGFSTGFVD